MFILQKLTGKNAKLDIAALIKVKQEDYSFPKFKGRRIKKDC